MKTLISFFCLNLAITCFAKQHCSIKDKNICAQVKFKQEISRKSDSSFLLSFTREGEAKDLGTEPKVKLWMVMDNGHAHGSDPVKLTKQDRAYLVSNVWFLMMGTWYIKIKTNPSSEDFDISIPVCVGKTAKASSLGECK